MNRLGGTAPGADGLNVGRWILASMGRADMIAEAVCCMEFMV